MILATYPHMALNSHDVPGTRYKMWNTGTVPESKSAYQIIDWIAGVAKTAPDGCLQTLILNSHGKPGRILMGHGLSIHNVEEFRALRGLVQRIWIVACRVAYIKEAGTVSDGNYFCYRLAQETRAYVRAGTAYQMGKWNFRFIDELPYGYIDDWEGTVYTWNPDGKLV